LLCVGLILSEHASLSSPSVLVASSPLPFSNSLSYILPLLFLLALTGPLGAP
jgi:hypothetical protein